MIMTLKNIWSRKTSSIRVIVSFTIMITILCVFSTYFIALSDKINEVVFSYRSGHYFAAESDELPTGEYYAGFEGIDNVNHIVNYAVYKPIHKLYDLGLTVDGRECNCYHSEYRSGLTPPNASTAEIIFHRGELSFYDKGDIITPNDWMEAQYRWGDKVSLIYEGTVNIKANEVIVSEQFLKEYYLTDAVGKTLTIETYSLAGDENGTDGSFTKEKHSAEFTIAGVLAGKYYQLTGNELAPQIIMSAESELYARLSDTAEMHYYTELHIIDYLSARTVARDLVETAGVVNFEVGSSYGLAMASTVSLANIVVVGVMATVGLGLIIALLFNVLYSMSFIISKKANYYGIIRAYGARDYKLFNLMFFEIFILAMLASLLAYGLSYAIVFLVDLAISSMIGIEVVFTPLNIGVTFIIALVSSAVLACVVSLCNYVLIRKDNIVELLNKSIEG